MELFRHFHGLSSVAPSSSSFCFDCARLLYLVKGWENLRELGKLSRAPFQNFNSSSHLVLLLHVFWVQRCSWPAASPSGQPSPLLCTLGMCSQNACFPLHHHPPLGAPQGTASLLSHSQSKGRLGRTGFCHILNVSIAGTAFLTLHFWLNGHVEHIPIGVHLGVTPMEG